MTTLCTYKNRIANLITNMYIREYGAHSDGLIVTDIDDLKGKLKSWFWAYTSY